MIPNAPKTTSNKYQFEGRMKSYHNLRIFCKFVQVRTEAFGADLICIKRLNIIE